jgi:hypothetical protein
MYEIIKSQAGNNKLMRKKLTKMVETAKKGAQNDLSVAY